MKKVVIIVIAGILFFSVFTVFLPVGICEVINGKTLYVGGSGSENYTKIKDAIDNASDGDTVFVYNGTYYEELIINKTIELFGQDRNSTFIVCGNSGFTVYFWDDVSNRSSIHGFTITHNNYPYPGDGIAVGSSSIKIYDNVITGNSDGIFIGLGLTEVFQNEITDNQMDGIVLHWESDYSSIYENKILNNNGVGIAVKSSNNLIKNNTINNNEDGIQIHLSADFNNITLNTVIGNNKGFLISPYCCYNNIFENFISSNNYGIFLQATDETKQCENNYYDNNFSNNDIDFYDESTILGKKGTPGFELILIICAITLVLLLKRKRIS